MIVLDIYKSYDALERKHCLDILAVYGVRPWSSRILRRYWDQLTMVAWARG